MADDCKESPQCSLDQNGCLKLSSILHAFNAAVSEEQAWALCFQAAKCIVNEWNSDCSSCYCLTDTSHILINKDGIIHRSTVKPSVKEAGKRKLAKSEYMLVHDLGVMVFRALDYGLCQDEERKLSPPLEFLIDRMTSASPSERADDSDAESDTSQNADEGIEQDSGEDDHIFLSKQTEFGTDRKGMTLIKVMEMCSGHLSCPRQADSHYKAVCRALVAEVLELSTFLENISSGAKNLIYSAEGESDSKTLEKLKVQDWARLWMQVIQQLRHGVKLKKVDPAQIHPIEYALTPYEMLLDDIRSRRYKLRQVMVNGDIPPRVKKDAHALILEFIRSRPPLVPASNRKLPPSPPRQLTLYDKLMASIKQEHKLKPTTKENEVAKRKIETSRTKLADTDDTPEPHRRLIKADLSLLRLPSSFEDDDIDDIPQTPLDEPQSLPQGKRNSDMSPLVRSNSFTGSVSSSSDRRHSISVCESPPKPGDRLPLDLSFSNFATLSGNSSQSRSDYWKSSQWQSLECLSLTLEEVVHIRNVLTKAELESLLIDPTLYEDILKGKICFTCKQVRFSFFGPWGIKCKMCERTVCDKCSSKMRIPTEHFARIPVYMLSPTPSPPPEEESSHTFWKFSDVFGSSVAADVEEQKTPKLSRQKTVAENSNTKRRLSFRHSESVHMIAHKKSKNSTSSSQKKKPLLQRSKTVQHPEPISNKAKDARDDKLKGPLVSICRECKVMVCNIIMASQDKVSYDLRRRRNSKTWPQKRASSNACMTPLSETAPSSPESEFM